MLRNFCFKKTSYVLIFFFLGGCSALNLKQKPLMERNADLEIQPFWFNPTSPGKEDFTARETNEFISTHPFFDVDPLYDENSSRINFIPTTVKNSAFYYDFDMVSGKLYKTANLCKQKDPWGSYEHSVEYPPVSLGFIPRVTIKGEQFKPLKAVVFHPDDKNNPPKNLSLSEFMRIKIIGSFRLKECHAYPCRGKESWSDELYLVGVSVKNLTNNEIENSIYGDFRELKNSPEWQEAKAFLHTQLGVFPLGNTDVYPRFSVIDEAGINEATRKLKTEVDFLSEEKILAYRNNCRQTLDQLYQQVNKMHASVDAKQEFKKFTIDLLINRKTEINRCLQNVRPAFVNKDEDRFWFFAFLRAVLVLDEEDFYFNCQQKTWYPNPKDADLKYMYSSAKELEHCKDKEAELIYESAINGMGIMQNQIGKTYRFVEYDTQTGGSHQKIYSWLKYNTKRLQCPKENILLEDIFPTDIEWKEFKSSKTKTIR